MIIGNINNVILIMKNWYSKSLSIVNSKAIGYKNKKRWNSLYGTLYKEKSDWTWFL